MASAFWVRTVCLLQIKVLVNNKWIRVLINLHHVYILWYKGFWETGKGVFKNLLTNEIMKYLALQTFQETHAWFTILLSSRREWVSFSVLFLLMSSQCFTFAQSEVDSNTLTTLWQRVKKKDSQTTSALSLRMYMCLSISMCSLRFFTFRSKLSCFWLFLIWLEVVINVYFYIQRLYPVHVAVWWVFVALKVYIYIYI